MRAVLSVVLGLVVAFSLTGCPNPNFIGVQDFGFIVGNVVDQNGKPIANALVRATGTNTTARSGVDGGFNLQMVATGEQTVSATAAGFQPGAPVTVIVVKDQGVSAGNIALQSATPQT